VAIDQLAPGSYGWLARTAEGPNQVSNWVDYGPLTGSFPAFSVQYGTTGNLPPNPANLRQFQSDGTTLIPDGGVTPETTVVFRAVVATSTGTGTARLQVEVFPTSGAPTGNPTGESAFVASGSDATLIISGLAPGSYGWRARTVEGPGIESNWVDYPATTDFSVIYSTDPTSVPLPANLKQMQSNGFVFIAPGGVTLDTSVLFRATVASASGVSAVRLQVELQPAGTAFTGNPTAESIFVTSGSEASILLGPLTPGPYHWQAQTVDQGGSASGFVAFGTDPAFTVLYDASSVTAPPDPTGLKQLHLNGSTFIALGDTTSEAGAVIRATVSSSSAAVWVALQVEVQAVGTGLSGTPTAQGAFAAPGSEASVLVDQLADADYHWAARAIDALGNTSNWVSFGANTEAEIDFVVLFSAPGGGGGGGGTNPSTVVVKEEAGGCGLSGLDALAPLGLLAFLRRRRARR
jgi:hypothetical protein